MEARWTADGIRLGGDARQRFHDARGYGRRTDDGDLLITPLEAAHLLYRGDIETVDGHSFSSLLRAVEDNRFVTRFRVYLDLRRRGFYLRPNEHGAADFLVYARGTKPPDGRVAYRIRVRDEARALPVADLEPGTLALVDAEGEIGYVRIGSPELSGHVGSPESHGTAAVLVGDRVLVWDPPPSLYPEFFFGQPLGGRDELTDPLQLSLVEAAYLDRQGVIDLKADRSRVETRGRSITGQEFDQHLGVYTELRERGIVTKTGYKFGASFRLYPTFEEIEAMGHSKDLVRIYQPEADIEPRMIADAVRLAHGVGKRMLFAIRGATAETTTWRSLERLTP